MSYSEATGKLILCSADVDSLDALVSTIRSNLDKKGAQYSGPSAHRLSHQEISQFLRHLDDPESEKTADKNEIKNIFFEIASNNKNINRLALIAQNQSDISIRRIIIVGQESIRDGFSFDKPDDVFVVAVVGQKQHKKGRGYDPYTWDPNVDHIPSYQDE